MLALEAGRQHKLAKARTEELQHHLGSWTRIHHYLTTWSLEEVEKLIALEVEGQNRPRVLNRLVARRSSMIRQQDLEDLGIAKED